MGKRKRRGDVAELASRLVSRYGGMFAILLRRARADPWDGTGPVSLAHRVVVESPAEPGKHLSVLLTFDVGYHNSGWWRNSQYDRCFHLSMVVVTPASGLILPDGTRPPAFETPTEAEMQAVAQAVFGDDVTKAWIEPPASKFDPYRTAPASSHCWHVRLFVDRRTGQPIKPEGEVYHLKPWPEGDSPEKVFR